MGKQPTECLQMNFLMTPNTTGNPQFDKQKLRFVKSKAISLLCFYLIMEFIIFNYQKCHLHSNYKLHGPRHFSDEHPLFEKEKFIDCMYSLIFTQFLMD